MKVKIKRASMWFQVGETYDIDHDLALQLIALGDAEALNEIKEEEPATVKKVERQADKRAKK